VSKLQGRFVFVHSSLLLSRSPYAPPLSLKHQINRIVFFLVLSCLLLSPPLSISSTPSAPHCCGEWVAGDEKLSAVPVGGGGTTTKARNQEGRQRYSLLTNIGWSQCTIAHSQRHPRTTARTKGKKKTKNNEDASQGAEVSVPCHGLQWWWLRLREVEGVGRLLCR
jgi:hypothetical protein